jgi:hypothetical protein
MWTCSSLVPWKGSARVLCGVRLLEEGRSSVSSVPWKGSVRVLCGGGLLEEGIRSFVSSHLVASCEGEM